MSFISDYQRESKRHSNRGRCFHYSNGTRCDEIISAHSIQSKGQLNLIAEAGHVYRLDADLSNLKKTDGRALLKKIGVKKVSTFAGFCKSHDNALFEPIDNFPLEPGKRQVALYAYRCICRELFVKENAVAVTKTMKDYENLSPQSRSMLEAVHLGKSIGLAGLQHHKVLYDRALLTKDYEQFEFTYFTSSKPCNIQLSGLLYPDFDFEGRFLQDLRERNIPLDLVTFFTAPVSNGWAFGFAWHVSSNPTCLPFIQSLASRVAKGERPEDALFRFSLCCENHAIRISWWDSLDESATREALERMNLMGHPQVPVPSNYLVSGCEGIATWDFDYVHTTLKTA
ncbi:hypothetical protein [Paraburkholderia sp. IW21]|uniref:hypothetical protein n=1 Tax=Paraburkholderia sp. IW21 TaxID=3242488 RepID=UPI0035206BCE